MKTIRLSDEEYNNLEEILITVLFNDALTDSSPSVAEVIRAIQANTNQHDSGDDSEGED